MTIQEQDKAAEIVAALSRLALLRTAYSSERAVMAWMRAAISLYTFGFAISKFIDYLELQQGAEMPVGLRRVGVVLISMGVVSLALAVGEHWNRMRKMRALGLPPESHVSLPAATAGALIAIGGATLVALTTGWLT